jgi:hypothetical protein
LVAALAGSRLARRMVFIFVGTIALGAFLLWRYF